MERRLGLLHVLAVKLHCLALFSYFICFKKLINGTLKFWSVFPVHPLWRFPVDLLWAVVLVPLRNQSTGKKTESQIRSNLDLAASTDIVCFQFGGPSSEWSEKKLILPGPNSGIWLQDIESNPFLSLAFLFLNERERDKGLEGGREGEEGREGERDLFTLPLLSGRNLGEDPKC